MSGFGGPAALADVAGRITAIQARFDPRPPAAATDRPASGSFDAALGSALTSETLASLTGGTDLSALSTLGGLSGLSGLTGLGSSLGGAGFLGQAGSGSLGTGNLTGLSGLTGAGLLTGLSRDRTGIPTGNDAVSVAVEYLGVPYVRFEEDPSVGLDCSGLTQVVFERLGIELPRVSADQARVGQAVASLAEAKPGDLLFFHEPVSHVAIYAGNGKMIHAPSTGDVVKVSDVDTAELTGIRRLLPERGAVQLPGVSTWTAPQGASGRSTYEALFQQAGARYGVDPSLLAAVAQVESSFRTDAVSSAGAQGLMQLMPGTAAELGVTDPFEPAQAIDGAARLLARLFDRFGSVELALAAYNAGAGAVERAGGVPSPGVQGYVDKVLAAYGGGV